MTLQCSECSFQVIGEQLLLNHLRDVHYSDSPPDPNTILKCKQCDYTTNNRRELRLHQDLHNPRDTNLKCRHCNYSASRKWNLARHVEIVHQNFRYNCTYCPYNTSRKSYLLQHTHFVHRYCKLKNFQIHLK